MYLLSSVPKTLDMFLMTLMPMKLNEFSYTWEGFLSKVF